MMPPNLHKLTEHQCSTFPRARVGRSRFVAEDGYDLTQDLFARLATQLSGRPTSSLILCQNSVFSEKKYGWRLHLLLVHLVTGQQLHNLRDKLRQDLPDYKEWSAPGLQAAANRHTSTRSIVNEGLPDVTSGLADHVNCVLTCHI
jgi:hypothetical protein